MEELLKMIGLRKVKNAVVDLFKASSVFEKMEAEAQKTNVMPLNFCFLGNPVL